jgi:phosphoribosylaminoimidazole-succinocarboxamide synthase
MPAVNLPLIRRGKVREVYRLPADDGGPRVLMVASDRISAFDVVMPTPIRGKGRLLTEIAAWWLRFIERKKLAATHLLSTSVDDVPESAFASAAVREEFRGRVTIGRACRVLPVECVVRGYLEGGGWKDYQSSGAVCGVKLPKGLRQCEKLPEPIFTPATKAAEGHDENITFDQAADTLGIEMASVVKDMSLAIYKAAAEHALSRGIIIADTKFEFGIPEDEAGKGGRVFTPPIVIDEALTPDSSRFWPVEGYEAGRAQKSFDKQFLREHLEELVRERLWNKQPPGPELPALVVEGTLARYREARDRLCVG